MSSMHWLPAAEHEVRAIRVLSAALAMVVLLDVIDVRAPGLALLAVPFAVAAIGLRRAGGPATIALLLFSCLYVVVGVSWMVANIADGSGAGWGDMLFGYVGTPLAAVLGLMLVLHVVHLRGTGNRSHSLA
jgi:hypothetical protein